MAEQLNDLTQLQPCPFCGGVNLFLSPPTCRLKTPYNPADRLYPIVMCRTCHAEIAGANEDYRGGTAIAAWNRRALPAEAEGMEMAAKICEKNDSQWKSEGAMIGKPPESQQRCLARAEGSNLDARMIRQAASALRATEQQQTGQQTVDLAGALSEPSPEHPDLAALFPKFYPWVTVSEITSWLKRHYVSDPAATEAAPRIVSLYHGAMKKGMEIGLRQRDALKTAQKQNEQDVVVQEPPVPAQGMTACYVAEQREKGE